MSNEIKIIIAVGTIWIVFVNLTRIVWKKTETVDYNNVQKVACLQGGGTLQVNGFNEYMGCEKAKN